MLQRPPLFSLFPYTTHFRSKHTTTLSLSLILCTQSPCSWQPYFTIIYTPTRYIFIYFYTCPLSTTCQNLGLFAHTVLKKKNKKKQKNNHIFIFLFFFLSLFF